MTVYRRAYKAPAKLAIPQGNWSGTIVIAPNLTARTVSADHSKVPGVILHHSPARSGVYIGCPGIALLPNGDFLVANIGPAGGVWQLGPNDAVVPYLMEVDGVPLAAANFVFNDGTGRIWITVTTRSAPLTKAMGGLKNGDSSSAAEESEPIA